MTRWENNPLQNQQAWKSRNFSSPQITGYIFWGFPNWMVQIIWFSNWKFWFSHWFLIGPAFCEGILKQMKSLDVNQETPQKGNLYSYVYWKSTEKKKDKWHACVTITPEDSSQANTYLTVKTSQVCKCKLFVSVSFLDYAENFLLKVKLKGNKFCVIYLYSFSKKYREIFLKKLLKPAYENLHNFILYLLFKF